LSKGEFAREEGNSSLLYDDGTNLIVRGVRVHVEGLVVVGRTKENVLGQCCLDGRKSLGVFRRPTKASDDRRPEQSRGQARASAKGTWHNRK
jgi:hypothetical protein